MPSLFEQALSSGAGAFCAFVAFWIFATLWGKYLGKKGENQATKEDIGAITEEIQKVEHAYRKLLEEIRGRNQLRIAGIDKRLQAHQEAFTHWREIQINMHRDEIQQKVFEAQEWWNKNCIYLEPIVRDLFLQMTQNALNHEQLIKSRVPSEQLISNFRPIETFPAHLFDAIKLPTFSEPVQKLVSPFGPTGNKI